MFAGLDGQTMKDPSLTSTTKSNQTINNQPMLYIELKFVKFNKVELLLLSLWKFPMFELKMAHQKINLCWRLWLFQGSQVWSDTFWLSISVPEKTNWRDYLPRSCLRWTWACAWWSEACLPCHDWSQDLWAFAWPKKESRRGEGLHFWKKNL